jgi:RNA polymerase sigma factor (sigma-70 family)
MAETPVRALLHSLRRAGLTDAQLLERFVTQQDEAAFEVLLWRHSAMVLGLCRRVLRQEQDAEDAFQATFLTLARRAASISSQQALGSWLYKVAYRIALAARRQSAVRRARDRALRFLLPAKIPSMDADADLQALVDDEIQRLPEKYRSAVVLCYFEGKTNEAAAAEMGCPKGTVVSRLARARQRLRRRLTQRGVEAPTLLLSGAGGAWSTSASRDLLRNTCAAALAKTWLNPASGLVSARVITLAQGAMRTMLWTKVRLALIGMAVAIVGAGGLGVAAHAFSSPGAAEPGEMAALAPAAGAVLPEEPQDPAPRKPRRSVDNENALRMASANHLKQIVLAMHNYHDVHGRFPAPALYGPDGKALLSWRVELLPFLEQNDLYKQFRRDQAWDSPHNRALLDKMPDVYALPGAKKDSATYYQVFVGPGAAFEKHRQRRLDAFTDGTSNTIMVAEAAAPVPWTKPQDLVFDPEEPLPELGGAYKDVFNIALADGSVHAVPRNFDKGEFRKAVTCNGGELQDQKRLFGNPPPEDQRARRRQDNDLAEGLQDLHDEVLSLKAEVKRLRERVQRLENGR